MTNDLMRKSLISKEELMKIFKPPSAPSLFLFPTQVYATLHEFGLKRRGKLLFHEDD